VLVEGFILYSDRFGAKSPRRRIAATAREPRWLADADRLGISGH